NLEYFTSLKGLNRWQACWMELLPTYDFKSIYRPGPSNERADTLSGRSEYRPEGGSGAEADKEPTARLDPNQIDWNPRSTDVLIRQVAALSLSSNITLLDTTSITALTTQAFDQEFLREIHAARIEDKTWKEAYKALTQDPISKVPVHLTIDKENKVLLWKQRLYIPDNDALRVKILESEHDSRVAGHFGQDKTVELIRRN